MPDWGVLIPRSRNGLVVWVNGGFPVPGRDERPHDAAAGVRFHGPQLRLGRGASSFLTVFHQVAV